MATTSGVGGTSSTDDIKFVDPDKIGFSGLTSEDFMKILVVQLQNQDPTNPMESDQLLAQVSDMRNLQASLDLEKSLKSLTLNQQLSNSAGLIGKTVSGTSGENTIQGVVEGVQVREGTAYLRIGQQELELANVEAVAA